MSGSNITIRFYLNEGGKSSARGFKIYCRVIIDRKKAEFATDEFCKQERWDKETGLPKKGGKVREYLIHIESQIREIKRNLEYQGERITAKLVRDLYLNRKSGKPEDSILDFYEQHIQTISQLPD